MLWGVYNPCMWAAQGSMWPCLKSIPISMLQCSLVCLCRFFLSWDSGWKCKFSRWTCKAAKLIWHHDRALERWTYIHHRPSIDSAYSNNNTVCPFKVWFIQTVQLDKWCQPFQWHETESVRLVCMSSPHFDGLIQRLDGKSLATGGIEPPTLALLAPRSNQLS